MYEVEMKAEIAQEVYESLSKELQQYFSDASKYYDDYYDSVNGHFVEEEKELRIRQIINGDHQKYLLTYKDQPIDDASKSKPEYEVIIDDVESMKVIIEKLGYTKYVSLVKECRNYNLTQFGYDFLITLVYLEELASYFIEIEIQVEDERGIEKAKEGIFKLLALLNIDRGSLTNEYYTDAVRRFRQE